MIRLTCTNCKANLTMDDAFAGGVCRCQHCGTIQTVPKATATGVRSGAVPMPAKALFQKKVHADGAGLSSGTGLDQLAEAVASSGLAGSGLSSGRMRARTALSEPAQPNAAGQQQRRLMLLMGIGLGVVIILLGIVIILMLRGGGISAPAPNSHGNGSAALPPAVTPSGRTSSDNSSDSRTPGPPQPERIAALPEPVMQAPALKPPHAGDQTFCGVALDGPVVIFLLDRGQGTTDTFDLMRVACTRSLETLKPQQKFQVILWNNSAAPMAFPEGGPAPATADAIQKLRSKLDDIAAFGQSDVISPLQQALAAKPSKIVLVTGKLVDDDFAAAVLAAHNGSATKIDTVLLGQREVSAPLQQIAEKTGGQYHSVSQAQLQDFSQ